MILNYIIALSGKVAGVANDSISKSTGDKLLSTLDSISGMTQKELGSLIFSHVLDFGINIIKVLLVWWIGRWITKRLISLMKKIMCKRNTDASIQTFAISFVDIVLLILLIVIIISIFGIDTTSFVALFASAGVAIGMALSGTLQNFAGGVMILVFRPYKVGDVIEAQGQLGTVKEIQIFSTLIQTPDNKIIFIPNGGLSTGVINNYSRETTRRIDFTFSISYGDDFGVAKQVLEELIAGDGRILKTPEPLIVLGNIGESSIDITMRVWAAQSDYWPIRFDMNRNVYETFPQKGLNFPFKTMTLKMEQ